MTSPKTVLGSIALADHARAAGIHFGCFTATARLTKALERSGLDLVRIADAHADRIPNPQDWGSCYAQDPAVYVVGLPTGSDQIAGKENGVTPYQRLLSETATARSAFLAVPLRGTGAASMAEPLIAGR